MNTYLNKILKYSKQVLSTIVSIGFIGLIVGLVSAETGFGIGASITIIAIALLAMYIVREKNKEIGNLEWEKGNLAKKLADNLKEREKLYDEIERKSQQVDLYYSAFMNAKSAAGSTVKSIDQTN